MKTLVTFAICLAIASLTFCQSTSTPKGQHEKEQQLQTALEHIREAIDHYRGMADRAKIQAPVGSRNYPLDLETLVKGVMDVHGQTVKFLPKIPVDPMTGTTDWGLTRVPGVVAAPEGGGISTFTRSPRVRLWTVRNIEIGKFLRGAGERARLHPTSLRTPVPTDDHDNPYCKRCGNYSLKFGKSDTLTDPSKVSTVKLPRK